MTMRATLTAGQLRAILAPACDVVQKKHMIPALSSVRLEFDPAGKKLHVTAQDLDTVLWQTTDASGKAGAVLAPCHALYRIARSAPADEWVTLTTADKRLIIDFRDSRFSLLTIPTEDFPDIEWAGLKEASDTFTVPAGWMQKVLGKAEPFISTEETRYYLNGVCWHTLDNGLALVATDGHRLARIKSDIECSAAFGNSQVILPRYAVRFLVKNVKCSTRVYFTSEKRVMYFNAQGMRYATKMIDGAFPDYKRVLPQGESAFTLAVNSDKLLAALRRVTATGAKTITIMFNGTRLVASAKDFDSNAASIALPGTTAGHGKPITINASYLQTICRVAKGGQIDIAFRDPGEPVAMTEGPHLYVQMPMRGDHAGFVELPANALAA